jgi:diguanylate cyclase (GGDEF)-like protein
VTGPVRKPASPSTPRFGNGAGSAGSSPTIIGPESGRKSDSGSARGARTSGHSTTPGNLDPGTKNPIRNASASKESGTHQAPVFELVDRIPPVVRAALVALALIALAMWAAWVRDRRRLAANAFVDPVTGIANSTAFTQILDHELARARRYKRPLGLLLLDLRDAENHNGKLRLMGATRIREATAMIAAKIRETDTVASLEGDRFAVICPEATEGASETLARALESSLEMLRLHAKVAVVERRATDFGAADLILRATAALKEPEAAPQEEQKEEKPRLLRVA